MYISKQIQMYHAYYHVQIYHLHYYWSEVTGVMQAQESNLGIFKCVS